jgi:hypothetical protein
VTDEGWKNKLYFGDNLNILREHVPNESVNPIYLDPPFNSKATYNVLFQEKNGTQSAVRRGWGQILSFDIFLFPVSTPLVLPIGLESPTPGHHNVSNVKRQHQTPEAAHLSTTQ